MSKQLKITKWHGSFTTPAQRNAITYILLCEQFLTLVILKSHEILAKQSTYHLHNKKKLSDGPHDATLLRMRSLGSSRNLPSSQRFHDTNRERYHEANRHLL